MYGSVLFLFLGCSIRVVFSFGVDLTYEEMEGTSFPPEFLPILSMEYFKDSSTNNENYFYPLEMRIIELPNEYYNKIHFAEAGDFTYSFNPVWYTTPQESIFPCFEWSTFQEGSQMLDLECNNQIYFENAWPILKPNSYGMFYHFDEKSGFMYSFEESAVIHQDTTNTGFSFRRWVTEDVTLENNETKKVIYVNMTVATLNEDTPWGTFETYFIHHCNPADMIKVEDSVFIGLIGPDCSSTVGFLDKPYTRLLGYVDIVLEYNETFGTFAEYLCPVEIFDQFGHENYTNITYFDEVFDFELRKLVRWDMDNGTERLVMVGNLGNVIVTDSHLNVLKEYHIELYSEEGASHIVNAVVDDNVLYVNYAADREYYMYNLKGRSMIKPSFISIDLVEEEIKLRKEIDRSLTVLRMDILEDRYIFLFGEEAILQLEKETFEIVAERTISYADIWSELWGEEWINNLFFRKKRFFSAVPPDIIEEKGSDFKTYHYRVFEAYYEWAHEGIQVGYHNLDISLCHSGEKVGSVNYGVCEPCEEGTYTLVSGQPSCSQGCPAGSFPNSNFTSCLPCPKGHYSNEPIFEESECLPCGKGTYSDVEGISSSEDCKPCPPGTKGLSKGLSDVSQCVECAVDEECLSGTAISHDTELLTEQLFYSEIQEDLVSQSWTFLSKVIILCVIFWCATCCEGLMCLSTLVCCLCRKYCRYERICDCFYSMKHKVREGESVVKKSTFGGAVFSVAAIFVASCLGAWSIFDFVFSNTNVRRSTTLGISSGTSESMEEWTFGKYTSKISVFGDFESCSQDDFTSSFYSDGFSEPGVTQCEDYESSTSSSGEYVSEMKGCTCVWECEDCTITKSEMRIYIDANTDGQYIKSIEYESTFPHFNEGEQFEVDGNIVETDETLEYVQSQFSLFRTLKVTYSYLNLLSQMVDYTHAPESHGVLASVLTNDKETNPSPQNSITIEMVYSLSIYYYEIVESQKLSLIYFIAQIAALFSLSVGVVGIFYSCCGGFVNLPDRLFQRYLFGRGDNKKRKVSDETPQSRFEKIVNTEAFRDYLDNNEELRELVKKHMRKSAKGKKREEVNVEKEMFEDDDDSPLEEINNEEFNEKEGRVVDETPKKEGEEGEVEEKEDSLNVDNEFDDKKDVKKSMEMFDLVT